MRSVLKLQWTLPERCFSPIEAGEAKQRKRQFRSIKRRVELEDMDSIFCRACGITKKENSNQSIVV